MKARALPLLLALACTDAAPNPTPGRSLVIEADSPATRGEVLAESVGIETSGGEVALILEAGCALPCEERVTFGTFEDDQAEIMIYVFRGNSGRTADSHALGAFEVAGLPPAPGGELDVAVYFHASEQGLSLRVEENSGAPIVLRSAGPEAY